MQYFIALKLGEKRVKQSQDLLNLYTGNAAMPALALKDTKTNVSAQKPAMPLANVCHLQNLMQTSTPALESRKTENAKAVSWTFVLPC